MQPQFSEITINGQIPANMSDLQILAAALNDWGVCAAGNRPPENFGVGMAMVGQKLNVTPTPDKLMELSEILREGVK